MLRQAQAEREMASPPAAPPQSTRLAILVPFAIVTLLWGSTWIVIRDQLSVVPASWSVTYRFAVAGMTMLIVALVRRESFRLDARGWRFAAALALSQFCLNFNFVYRAEEHIGSAVAMAGIALLFVHEARADPNGPGEALIGIGITLLAILSASSANVLQATETARAYPMVPMLAVAMPLGAAMDAGVAFALTGAPVIEPRWSYIAGILYLGVFASALAFTLYFGVIRVIGPAKAAYSSVIVPVIAMLLSTMFEGYRWTPLAVAGGVLTLVGLVIALKARRPSR